MDPQFSHYPPTEPRGSMTEPDLARIYRQPQSEYQGQIPLPQPVQYPPRATSYPSQPAGPYSSQPPAQGPYPSLQPFVPGPYTSHSQQGVGPYPSPPHPPAGRLYLPPTSKHPSYQASQPQYSEHDQYRSQPHNHGSAPREPSNTFTPATSSFYHDGYQNVYNSPNPSADASFTQGYYTQVPSDAPALHSAPAQAAPQTMPSSTVYNATHAHGPNVSMHNSVRLPPFFDPSSTNGINQLGAVNIPGSHWQHQPRPPIPTIPQPQQRVYDGENRRPLPRQDLYDVNLPHPGAYGATATRPQQRVYDAATAQPRASGAATPQPPTNPPGSAVPQPPTNSASMGAVPQPPTNSASMGTVPQPPTNSASMGTVPQPPLNASGSAVPQPIPFTRQDGSTATMPCSTTQNDAAERPTPPTFVPPLDLGPSATHEQVVELWEALTAEDHVLMSYIQKQRELAESVRLFTVGSSESKLNAANAKKRKPSRQAQRHKSTAQRRGSTKRDQPAGTSSQATPPGHNPVNMSGHTPVNMSTPPPAPAAEQTRPPQQTDAPAGQTSRPPPVPPKSFKTVRVEDYYSDSDDETESDEDTERIPSHAKGKGRAVDWDSGHPPSPKIPTLNPRPNAAPPVQNHGSPFSAVLDAFHTMNQRMNQLEISMTQGLKQMGAKLSDFSAEPPVVPTPMNPTARMTKTQATIARILAGRETSQVSHRTTTSTRVPTRFGYATVPHGRTGIPAQPQAAPDGIRFGPGAHEAPPAQNAQTSASSPIPPVFDARSGAPQGPHLPPVNQGPYGVTGVPNTHLPSAPATSVSASPMTVEEMGENMKLYRKYVRSHLWEQLLAIKGVEQLQERCPRIPDDEYERYLLIKGRVVNATNFRIDFTRGWERCKFNKEARSFFAHHFVSCVQGGMYQNPPLPAPWVTVDMAAEVLDAVIVHVFRGYSEHSKPPTVHNQAKAEMTKERKRANTRRETLLKWRIETLNKLDLKRHLVLFSNMTPAHLSGDEAAVGSDLKHSHYRLFYIVEAAWQSRGFRNFVRDLDKWYIYFSRPKVGATQRGGNRPRIREELPKGKARVVDSIAPRGLWRNCYDQDWLNTLKACEREDLGIIDEDYDFSLPPPPELPVELQPASAATQNSGSSPYPGAFTFSAPSQPQFPGSSFPSEPIVPVAQMHGGSSNPTNASAAVSHNTTSTPATPSAT